MGDRHTYCITGGSGSLGTALAHHLLGEGHKVRTISRNEHRISALEEAVPSKLRSNLSCLVGDVRDRYRLHRAFARVDYVIHAAALKGVGRCEFDPAEAMKTNVVGTQAVADACLDAGVKRAVFVSSDKACSPHNLYGMTKACGERLWLASNRYSAGVGTEFIAVRWGNVFGSNGSVIHRWREDVKEGREIIMTDPACTRFHIRIPQAVEFLLKVLDGGDRDCLFIPELRAYRLKELAWAMGENKWECIGLQAGEKKHETLLTDFEAPYSVRENGWVKLTRNRQHGVPEWAKGMHSGSGARMLTVDELKEEIAWLKNR